MSGQAMHALARQLWPLNRSLTGDGVRDTLARLRTDVLPGLQIHEVASGTDVFDWTVPREWRVRDAYLETPDGRRICRFADHNLHLVGYSVPVDRVLTLDELQPYLHSLPEQPDAIPYITSYYQERWGFCLTHRERAALTPGTYRAVIDADLADGAMTYADLVIPGDTEEEILISTYICHPSMANNELSGIVVSAFLARWVATLPRRRHTFRFVFVPETIGSIAYIHRHLDHLRARVKAGFVLTCLGDERAYSLLPSRRGQTLSDRAARHVLRWIDPAMHEYGWADRGSDERQYCSPGVDLPVASIMRSKYGCYPEYHTSLDDLDHVVTPAGLEGGYEAVRRVLEALERHACPRVTTPCEPMLGRHGLYRSLSTLDTTRADLRALDVVTWADGSMSLFDIADQCGVPVWELYPIVDALVEKGLLSL